MQQEAQNLISKVYWNKDICQSLDVLMRAPRSFIKCAELSNEYWFGKIGLMYAIDYGYATSGGLTMNRETCLNSDFRYGQNANVKECIDNNWLNNSTFQWTMTVFDNIGSSIIFDIASDGKINSCITNNNGPRRTTKPVVYLKSEIKITDGNGSKTNPFILGY